MFEESIDSLSTYLVLSQPLGGSVHALAVTSAETREGKTSVASTLALSVAQVTSSHAAHRWRHACPDVHKLFESRWNRGWPSCWQDRFPLAMPSTRATA
jgi:hypothetical protein